MTITITDVAPVTSHETAVTAILRPVGVFDLRQSLESLKVTLTSTKELLNLTKV